MEIKHNFTLTCKNCGNENDSFSYWQPEVNEGETDKVYIDFGDWEIICGKCGRSEHHH